MIIRFRCSQMTLHSDRFDRIALIFESINAASTFRTAATADFRHDCAEWPGEFHPEPLTDPDLTLSRHPARATARRLPPSIEYRVPPVAG
jgi:hypothetical protein